MPGVRVLVTSALCALTFVTGTDAQALSQSRWSASHTHFAARLHRMTGNRA